MKLKLIIIFLTICCQLSFSQEINQLKDYFSNSLYNINPAAAGYNGGFVSQLSYSKKWTDVPGSPVCQVLSNSIRLGEEEFYDPRMFKTKPMLNLNNRVSLGLTIYNEAEGPIQHTGLMAAYAYHINVGSMRLSLGLAGLVTQYYLNSQLFNPTNVTDPDLFTHLSAFIPDINTGVMLFDRLFYVGLSVNGLVNFKKILDHHQSQPDIVYFMGNKFLISDRLIFEPSFFIWKYGQENFSTDINVKLYYKDDNWILFGYHGTGEIVSGVGIKLINGLQLGYTYNVNTTGLSTFTGGSQNFTLIANIATLKQKYKYSW